MRERSSGNAPISAFSILNSQFSILNSPFDLRRPPQRPKKAAAPLAYLELSVGYGRPHGFSTRGFVTRETAAEEMQMMRKLYNQMVMEKAQIKAEPMIQMGGLKKKDKEMAVA